MRVTAVALLAFATVFVAACTGGAPATTPDPPALAAPTASPLAPTTAPALTAVPERDAATPGATSEPAAVVASGPCPSGVEEQKSLLIALASERFVGVTAHDAELPKLVYDPVARDRRGGGIWVVVEFNGDELDTVPLKKAALDEQMRDGYEVLYGAGCADLVQVDITARTRTFGSYVGRGGGALRMPVVVFKTKLVRDVADTIDWANKESLDFNEIWDTLLLNPRWREELKDLEDGG